MVLSFAVGLFLGQLAACLAETPEGIGIFGWWLRAIGAVEVAGVLLPGVLHRTVAVALLSAGVVLGVFGCSARNMRVIVG